MLTIDQFELEDNGYESIESQTETEVVLKTPDGDLELFAVHDNMPASWYIETEQNKFLEFVRSIRDSLFVPNTQEDIDNLGTASAVIPHVGDNIPDGWRCLDKVMVDSSGFGQPGERALTIDQFKQTMEVGKGYATVDIGQFQVYVGIFERNEQ